MTVQVIKPLKVNSFVIPVRGVSFRQEVVRKLNLHETVFLRRNPENHYDPHAVRIENRLGELIGFVPKELSARVSAMPVHQWRGEVVDILKNETWGLRVRVSPSDTVFTPLPEPKPAMVVPDNVVTGIVYSRSGRELGELLSSDESQGLVTVKSGTGRVHKYPLSRVTIGE